MKLIDKLILKARSERGRLYYLIGFIVPSNNGYDANISIYKCGDIIEQNTRQFASDDELNEYTHNIAIKYELKNDDMILCFFDYGGT